MSASTSVATAAGNANLEAAVSPHTEVPTSPFPHRGSFTSIEDMDEEDDAEPLTTEWSTQNPQLGVHRPQTRDRPRMKTLSEAQKASIRAGRAAAKKRGIELSEKMSKLRDRVIEEATQVAEEFDKKPETIISFVANAQGVAKTRAPTLHNALAHFSAMDIIDGLLPSLTLDIEDLRHLAEKGIKQGIDALDPAEKARLLNGLKSWRDFRKTGARISPRSLIGDVHRTMSNANQELVALSARTGANVFGIAAGSNVLDHVPPMTIESPRVSQFFPDVLNMTVTQFISKFELWSGTRGNKSWEERATIYDINKESADYIAKGLYTATGNSTLRMNYTNYERAIVLVHKVKIVGWPEGLPFTKPSDIKSYADAQLLRDAIKAGTLTWRKVTTQELAAVRTSVEEQMESGEIAPRKHRGPNKRKNAVEDDENAGAGDDDEARDPPPQSATDAPAKKKRRTKKSAVKELEATVRQQDKAWRETDKANAQSTKKAAAASKKAAAASKRTAATSNKTATAAITVTTDDSGQEAAQPRQPFADTCQLTVEPTPTTMLTTMASPTTSTTIPSTPFTALGTLPPLSPAPPSLPFAPAEFEDVRMFAPWASAHSPVYMPAPADWHGYGRVDQSLMPGPPADYDPCLFTDGFRLTESGLGSYNPDAQPLVPDTLSLIMNSTPCLTGT